MFLLFFFINLCILWFYAVVIVFVMKTLVFFAVQIKWSTHQINLNCDASIKDKNIKRQNI